MTTQEREKYAEEFGIDAKLLEVLEQRGFDKREKLNDFLYPSVDNLTDIHTYTGFDSVVDRIKYAIDNNESIILYGDYDCDGICGVSIMYNYLKSKGVQVECFLPNRHSDGYGLSIETLEKLADRYLSDLLITIDCGITSVEEVAYAREVLGFDVIVTDHHETGEDLPDCLIFNPKLTDNGAFRDICGAGVVLRIIEGLAGKEEMLKYIDIACIATIADVVPLIGDNRIIAKTGLKKINSMDCRRGIKLLAKTCTEGEITSYDIGFKIAPRINAVGRIGDANEVLDLFCTTDNFLLEQIVKSLNEVNAQRVQLTDDLTEECMQQLKGFDFENNAVIVLHNAYWDDGIIGIVASRIAETFNRPTVLLTKNGNLYKGSGRSIKGINIFDYVSKCGDLLAKYGGHAMAFGLSVKKENIAEFTDRLNSLIKVDFPMGFFIPRKSYDIDMRDVKNVLNMARGIKLLEPFGEGNPNIRFKETVDSINFEQMGGTQHLVYKQKDKELVLFSGLRYKEFLSRNVQKNLYYKLSLQSYRDRIYAQGKITSFSCDKVVEQGDYSQYLMTGFVKGEKEVKNIDLDQALQMANKVFGVCYIVYDIDTYNEFLLKLEAKNIVLPTENRVVGGYVPYTKILFCPSSLKELCYYQKIVFLDTPLNMGVFNKVLNSKANVFCVQNVNIFKKVASYLPDYKKLGQIFTLIKACLSVKTVNSVADLYYAIAKDNILEYNEYVLALLIFVDLGIVRTYPNFYVDASVKTKLTESSIYARLEAEKSGRTGN